MIRLILSAVLLTLIQTQAQKEPPFQWLQTTGGTAGVRLRTHKLDVISVD